MSLAVANRTLEWDWYGGTIPENVVLEKEAYLETTYSFLHYRSQVREGVRLGEGSTVYLGTMFDVGPGGRVSLGRCALLHGAWIICDAAVEIGDYALISWNVVLMDTYRACREPRRRRLQLRQVPAHPLRRLLAETEAQPIRIGRNAWIGFDCCVLPGITIGEGSIVGARSVVTENVPPYTVVAGNPARVIRPIHNDENVQTN
jgi:carbonic anhydrase/acetyltransferase-like protein (isoleucine patch superfamily)